MKKIFHLISVFVLSALACDLSVTIASPTALPATSTPLPATESSAPFTATPEIFIPLTQAVPGEFQPTALPDVSATLPSNTGTTVTYAPLTLVIPPQIADGASGMNVNRMDDPNAAYFERTPGHLKVSLGDYYVLKGKFHEPEIYVYPAQSYAELNPAAFESLHRLNNILSNPGAPIDPKTLPAVPFFNAQQVFASHIEVISFQNGKGARFVTEYAQYAASANNSDLFYNFIGVTDDGGYYVVAILPLTHPLLAETSDSAAVVPPGGIPYDYFTNPNADLMLYYVSVVQLLNNAASDTFTPTIGQLDALIQSMRIAP